MGKQEALASTAESVALFRSLLMEQKSYNFLRGLMLSLDSLGRMQNEMGMIEEALASVTMAVAARRVLASHWPDTFQPGLAQELNNLGVLQNAVGKRREALASTAEAVALSGLLLEPSTVKAREDAPGLTGAPARSSERKGT